MRKIVILLIITIAFAVQVDCLFGAEEQGILKTEESKVIQWRKERDLFFKTHQRSPLTPEEKRKFKGLKYFPFDAKYIFHGQVERYKMNIYDLRYYATFLTNKGANKRYIRFGKFRFALDGKEFRVEIYKSILGDALFIPFRDRTSGRETYGGGRYIDAEILDGSTIILDFNKAYHPSCAYNDKFVCALPPKENDLDVEIRAGEKNLK